MEALARVQLEWKFFFFLILQFIHWSLKNSRNWKFKKSMYEISKPEMKCHTEEKVRLSSSRYQFKTLKSMKHIRQIMKSLYTYSHESLNNWNNVFRAALLGQFIVMWASLVCTYTDLNGTTCYTLRLYICKDYCSYGQDGQSHMRLNSTQN